MTSTITTQPPVDAPAHARLTQAITAWHSTPSPANGAHLQGVIRSVCHQLDLAKGQAERLIAAAPAPVAPQPSDLPEIGGSA